MKLAENQDRPALETLTAVIAHSQIVVAKWEKPTARLPTGFEKLDVAILDWIVAEARRLGHGIIRM